MNEHDEFFQELQKVAADTQLDAKFTNDLENRLRQQYREQATQSNPRDARWLPVALFIISIGLLALLPPTQTLAVQIASFFFPTDSDTQLIESSEYGTYPEVVEVDSIEEAEAIAGFEAYEWTDERFELRWIFAAEGLINLAYEKSGERGSFIHISQMEIGLRPVSPFNAIPPETELIPIFINGFEGEYVEGYWVRVADNEVNEFTWIDNHFRQLHWISDDFDFRLMIANDLVYSVEDAIAIGEALVTQP